MPDIRERIDCAIGDSCPDLNKYKLDFRPASYFDRPRDPDDDSYPGEVPIAVVSLESGLGAELTFLARQDGDVIRYRVVDDYGEDGITYHIPIQSSSEPLTFAELLYQVWETHQYDWGPPALIALKMEEDIAFLNLFQAGSEFYPELSAFFAEEEKKWQEILPDDVEVYEEE